METWNLANSIAPLAAITQKGDEKNVEGLDEIVHGPASEGPNVPPVMPSGVPATPVEVVSATVGTLATVNVPAEKGVPVVIASPMETEPDVAEGPTPKLAVNVPFPSIVHVGLAMPDGRLSAQDLTAPVMWNPPPAMLTVLHPGGAPVGNITITFDGVVGPVTIVKVDAIEPPE